MCISTQGRSIDKQLNMKYYEILISDVIHLTLYLLHEILIDDVSDLILSIKFAVRVSFYRRNKILN